MAALKTDISNIEATITLTGDITLTNKGVGCVEDIINLSSQDFEDLKMFVKAANVANSCIQNWGSEE